MLLQLTDLGRLTLTILSTTPLCEFRWVASVSGSLNITGLKAKTTPSLLIYRKGVFALPLSNVQPWGPSGRKPHRCLCRPSPRSSVPTPRTPKTPGSDLPFGLPWLCSLPRAMPWIRAGAHRDRSSEHSFLQLRSGSRIPLGAVSGRQVPAHYFDRRSSIRRDPPPTRGCTFGTAL